METPTSPGVYRMTHAPTGITYVGATKNLRRRRSSHECSIRTGCNSHPKFHPLFGGVVDDDFVWEVLEEMETYNPLMLAEAEFLWLRRTQKAVGHLLVNNVNMVYSGKVKNPRSYQAAVDALRFVCQESGVRLQDALASAGWSQVEKMSKKLQQTV